MFDSATERIWCVDEEFRLLEMNPAFVRFIEEITGTAPAVGMNILEVFSDESAAIYWKDLYSRALRGESITTRQFHLKEGLPVETELRMYPMLDAHGAAIGVSCFSADKESEPGLRKRELVRNLLFKTALQNNRDAICAFDTEGRYISYNRRHARMVQRFFGVELQNGMRPDEFLKDTAIFQQLENDRKRALSGEFFTDSVSFETVPGQYGYLELFHAPFINEMGQVAGYSIVFQDVTEKHRRELQLKQLALSELRERKLRSAELQRINEERQRQKEEVLLATVRSLESERSRIASELHDDLGPELSKITSLLQVALADGSLPPSVRDFLEKSLFNAGEAQRSISEIIWSMDPRHNRLEDFVAYLRYYATQYFEGAPIRFKVNTPRHVPPGTIDGMTRRNLFLVVKECLNNILKHSAAGVAEMEVWIGDPVDGRQSAVGGQQSAIGGQQSAVSGQQSVMIENVEPNYLVRITISDDGKGFDTQNTSPFRNGQNNIRRRMDAVGGTLQVTSTPGHGTVVRLEAGC
jgi:PAS domain S-box-containing protein